MTLFATYKDKSDGVIRFYDLKERRNRIAIVLIYAACILMSFLFLYPVVWLLFACFKDTNELFQSLSIIPQELDLDGLARSWKRLDFGNAYFWSLYQCVGCVICSVVFNGLCGYALGVVKMRGHKLIWSLLMALLLVPSTGGFVVLYRSFVQLGINQGQIWPLYLGSGGSPFTIMMFKVFFEGIPRDYFEAASIDGASHVNIFSRIILPLSTPIVAITAINVFTGAWSDFLMPYLCLKNSGHETVMVKLFMQTGQGANVLDQLRASLFSVIPPIIFFCIFQKYIMNNNTLSGVKG